VETSLNEALDMNQTYFKYVTADTAHKARQIACQLEDYQKADLGGWLENNRELFGLSALQMFDQNLQEQAFTSQSGLAPGYFAVFPKDALVKALSRQEAQTFIQKDNVLNYAASAMPVEGGKYSGIIVVYNILPGDVLRQAQLIEHGLTSYLELKGLQQPFITQQYIILSIVALLVVFAATWFGFYLARIITQPLMEVAKGAQRVAAGDYDFFINQEGPDEIGALINAFNRMTADLKISRARLEEAKGEMSKANMELEQRRRYMEIVLNNVNAGIIALDARGIITNFNPAAERLLKIPASKALTRLWQDIIDPEYLPTAQNILDQLMPGRHHTFEKQIRLTISEESLFLMFHIGRLYDESDREIGMVVIFENLTELEKAQRMAAWREVARRIAHEVKNPLTPIKLSAQRLIHRFDDKLSSEDIAVFKECTETIVAQVEEIRNLVNEFSNFARLPNARLALADLTEICQEALALFRNAHQDIEYIMEVVDDIPHFNLDREQMGRVLINLLDNAATAVKTVNPPHLVVVRLSYDDILKIVRVEVEDNGPGVSPSLRLRLFEPYFSTKKEGTGLGLAIVNTIVADHNGYIRVQDNLPQGTRIVIELPIR
jgi:two-component system nitrogen regulation sensor histidine kinase NtrY